MTYDVKPMPFDPNAIKGLSPKLLTSHYDNNYTGAVKRLNAIEAQLKTLDWPTAPNFTINGLKREELVAMNSMSLHEIYFAGLGAGGDPAGTLAQAIERDFGSIAAWRAEFAAMGKAMGGGSGWVLLNYLMDARTGLGRFRDFRVSNYQLMMELIDYCAAHSIDEILALPDVRERADLYFAHREQAQDQIRRCATVHNNLIVLDLRNEETIFATNRFTIYAMYPKTNISIHVLWGLKRQNTAFAIGKSIVNRSSHTNVGELCLKYGGGGHHAAGPCQVEVDATDAVLAELIESITTDG